MTLAKPSLVGLLLVAVVGCSTGDAPVSQDSANVTDRGNETCETFINKDAALDYQSEITECNRTDLDGVARRTVVQNETTAGFVLDAFSRERLDASEFSRELEVDFAIFKDELREGHYTETFSLWTGDHEGEFNPEELKQQDVLYVEFSTEEVINQAEETAYVINSVNWWRERYAPSCTNVLCASERVYIDFVDEVPAAVTRHQDGVSSRTTSADEDRDAFIDDVTAALESAYEIRGIVLDTRAEERAPYETTPSALPSWRHPDVAATSLTTLIKSTDVDQQD